MANTLMKLLVSIGVDTSEFQRGIDDANKKVGTFSSGMQDVGKSVMKFGGIATVGMTLPLVAAGKTMVDAASDLSESANAVNVVFTQSSDTIHKFGQTSAESVGLAESEFNQLAAVTGAFLTNMGFNTDQAADETIKLTERAADMASIFNTDVSQALGAIQSGLKGEFNPLEQFGVKMNMAAVNAKALSMNVGLVESELTDNMKSAAMLAIIYEQTNKYAGDFQNTSDGLANSSRILKAELKDASAELGTQLLPYVLKAVQFFSGLIDKFNALTPAQKSWIVGLGAALAVLGPVVTIIGGIISAVGTILPILTAIVGIISGPVLIVIGVVIAAIAGLYLAWKTNFLGIRDTIQTVWEAVKLIFQAFKAAANGDWRQFGELLRQAWDTVWALIEKRIQAGKDFILNIGKSIVQGIYNVFHVDWSVVGKNIVQGIANGIKNGIQWVVNAARNVAQAAVDAAKGFLGIQSPSKVMMKLGEQTAQGFALGIKTNEGMDLSKILNLDPLVSSVEAIGSKPNVGQPSAGPGTNGSNITINIENPKAETSEDSIRRLLKSLSYQGVIS